jgi:hypothetical protein
MVEALGKQKTGSALYPVFCILEKSFSCHTI